jgi:DNA-binding response OmpR family regulator
MGLNILVVEDDANIANMLIHTWPDSRDHLKVIGSAKQTLRMALTGQLEFFHCVLMDVNLPDGSGLELLDEIRAKSSLPVILISGGGNADTRAEAITGGADDYVMKPFSTKELRARAARVIAMREVAKGAKPASRHVQIGAIQCDLSARTMVLDAQTQELTAAEARIIECLEQKRGEDCSKMFISREAFSREYMSTDKTIDVYINRIRKKLSFLSSDAASKLLTVRGIGYRLTM